MPASHCCRPVASPHVTHPHRACLLAVVLVLAGGLALILYFHGASWWYAPLAVPGAILAHGAMLGVIVFLATRVGRERRASGSATCCHGGTEHSHESGSELLHRPRQFDWLVRVITLGREKKLREWMLGLADLQPGNVVLDVGCGTGTLLLAAAERVGPSGSLHGIEPSR